MRNYELSNRLPHKGLAVLSELNTWINRKAWLLLLGGLGFLVSVSAQERLGGAGGETLDFMQADSLRGELWLAGTFQQTWDSLQSRGSSDVWLAYRQPATGQTWRLGLGDASQNRVLALALAPQQRGIYLLMQGRGELFLQGQGLGQPSSTTQAWQQYHCLHFDHQGRLQKHWRLAASRLLELQALLPLADGSLWLGGSAQGQLYLQDSLIAQFPDSLYGLALIHLDAQGQLLGWAQAQGQAEAEIKALVQDPQGQLQVLGSFKNNWTWGAFQKEANPVFWAIYRAWLNPSTYSWQKLETLDGVYDQRLVAVCSDSQRLYLLANFMGNIAFSPSWQLQTAFRYPNYLLWAWPWQAAGPPLWYARSYQWFGNSEAQSLSLNRRGDLALGGFFEPEVQFQDSGRIYPSQGYSDAFAAIYSPQGELKGQWLAGGAGFDKLQALAWLGDTLWLGGWYQGVWTQGPNIQEAQGYSDAFLYPSLAFNWLNTKPLTNQDSDKTWRIFILGDSLHIEGSAPYTWQLVDVAGRSLAQGRAEQGFSFRGLPSGYYLCRLLDTQGRGLETQTLFWGGD